MVSEIKYTGWQVSSMCFGLVTYAGALQSESMLSQLLLAFIRLFSVRHEV